MVRPSTDQEDLWVRYAVGAGPSHTKDFKNGSGSSLHGTHNEGGEPRNIIGLPGDHKT